MSITDEMRDWMRARGMMAKETFDQLTAIADRIDAKHERAVMSAMNDALYHANDESMAELGWVRLPVDADGVPIHVGDEVAFLGRMTVDATDGHNVFFFADNWADGVYCVRADELRHYHAPTVEDVLLDLLEEHSDPTCDATPSELAEKYAAKLRLAKEDE